MPSIFSKIFPRHAGSGEVVIPDAPVKAPNAHGTYKMTCPYCLKTFDVWEMPFRAKSAPQKAVNKVEASAGSGSRKRSGGYGKPAEAPAPQATPATDNHGYFPDEDDKLLGHFYSVRGMQESTVLGKVLTLFNPDQHVPNFVEGTFSGEGIDAVKIPHNDNWIPVSTQNQQLLRHKSITRIRDAMGHESSDRLCPHCHNSMPKDAGLLPNYTIMFMGNTFSGKTVYKIRLLHELCFNGMLPGNKHSSSYAISAMSTSGSIDGINAQSIISLYNQTFEKFNEGKRDAIADTTQIKYIAPLTFPLMRNGENIALITFYDFPGEALWKADDATYRTFMEEVESRLNALDGIVFLLDVSTSDTISSALPEELRSAHVYSMQSDTKKSPVPEQRSEESSEEPSSYSANTEQQEQQNKEDAERRKNALKSMREVLSVFQSKFITPDMTGQLRGGLSTPICFVFSKSDLLKKAVQDTRSALQNGNHVNPKLALALKNLTDPPICVTNWEEQGLEALRRTRGVNAASWELERLEYINQRISNHHNVDMENILRSHDELLSLFRDDLGIFLTHTPKGLLFAVSAVGVPISSNKSEPIAESAPIRLTEPLEYLLWQMGLADMDTENLSIDDKNLLRKLRTGTN